MKRTVRYSSEYLNGSPFVPLMCIRFSSLPFLINAPQYKAPPPPSSLLFLPMRFVADPDKFEFQHPPGIRCHFEPIIDAMATDPDHLATPCFEDGDPMLLIDRDFR